eukprot:GILJ01000725.1.p1 GENE.GILJ01000725.1~~GILJ01000725.1.p1  ORF type:complete len:5003 (-),score=847.36 GILJ01000725.1:252-15260(-)
MSPTLNKSLVCTFIAFCSFSFVAALSITSVSPTAGSVNGGTYVTISGSGFNTDYYTGNNDVMLSSNGLAVDCAIEEQLSSASRIICVSGANPLGHDEIYNLAVTVSVNSSTAVGCVPSDCLFSYVSTSTPLLAQVTPNFLPTGSAVTLRTSVFNNDGSLGTKIFIGTSACAFPSASSSSYGISSGPNGYTNVACLVNNLEAGFENVSYSIPALGSSLALPSALHLDSSLAAAAMLEVYPVVTAVTPSISTTQGGTLITISGSGFSLDSNHMSVQAGGSPCTIVSASNTEIQCLTSAHSGPVTPVSEGGRGMEVNRWLNLAGSSITDLTSQSSFPNSPDNVQIIDQLSVSGAGYLYGEKIRGYFVAPSTNTYTFYLTSNAQSQLWINSAGSEAESIQMIASVTNGCGAGQFGCESTQKSAQISLQAGVSYYLEVVHKAGQSADHVSVGVQLHQTLWSQSQTVDARNEQQTIAVAADFILETQTIEVSGAQDGTFALQWDGQTTSDIAYNASATTVADALNGLLQFTCSQDDLGALYHTTFDFESSTQAWPAGSGATVETVHNTAFCGRNSLKLTNSVATVFNVNKTGSQSTPYDTSVYTHMCMAYNIPASTNVSMLIHLTGRGWYTVTMTVKPSQAFLKPFDYPIVATWDTSVAPLQADGQWHHACINLADQLATSLGSTSFYVDAVTFDSPYISTPDRVASLGGSMYIDNFAILSSSRTVQQTGFPVFYASNRAIDTITVTATSPVATTTVYTVSIATFDCASDLPLFTADSTQLSGSLAVSRVSAGSPRVSGYFDISFNGATVSSISVQSSSSDLETQLSADPAFSKVSVSTSGSCTAKQWTVLFNGLTGDLPAMTVTNPQLTGINARSSVSEDVSGGIWLYPIPGRFLRAAQSTLQLTVTVNGLRSKCQNIDACQFAYFVSGPQANLTDVTPSSGTKGTVLTVTGEGFSQDQSQNFVFVGSHACNLLSSSTTQLSCQIDDELSGGVYPIQVSVLGLGYAAGQLQFTVHVSISAIKPIQTGTNGGAIVTISGQGFSDTSSVKISSTPCSVIDSSNSVLTCTAPGLADGTYTVTVTADNGISNQTSIVYSSAITPTVSNVTPNVVSCLGNTLVTISGSNFGSTPSAIRVTVNNVLQTLVTASDTELVIQTPTAAPGTYAVDVFVRGRGHAISSATLQYLLNIETVSPSTGSLMGGTLVTITGEGFGSNASVSAVSIADFECSIQSINDTQIVCMTTVASPNVTVQSNGKSWAPSGVNVALGSTVKWSWVDTHSIQQTPDINSAYFTGLGFRSPILKDGQFTYRFSAPGSHFFADQVYGFTGMRGSVTVGSLLPNINGLVTVSLGSITASVSSQAAASFSFAAARTPTISNVSPSAFAPSQSAIALTDMGSKRSCSNYPFAATCATYPYDMFGPSWRVNSMDSNSQSDLQITITGTGFSANAAENVVSLWSFDYDEIVAKSGMYQTMTEKVDVVVCSSQYLMTPTQLVCNISHEVGAGSYRVSVKVGNFGESFATKGLDQLYIFPHVTGISQTVGSQAGGSVLTITGKHFRKEIAKNIVLIGKTSCKVLQSNSDQILCQVQEVVDDGYSTVIKQDLPLAHWRMQNCISKASNQTKACSATNQIVLNEGSLASAANIAVATVATTIQFGQTGITGIASDTSASFINAYLRSASFVPQLNPNQQFSIELWMRPGSVTGSYQFVLNSLSLLPASQGYGLFINPCGKLEFWLGVGRIASSYDKLFCRNVSTMATCVPCPFNQTIVVKAPLFDPLHTSHLYSIATSSAVIQVNAWTHVVASFDINSGKQSIYINGQLSSNVTLPAGTSFVPNTDVSTSFYVGGINNATVGSSHFNGQLDEVAVYSTPLTSNQISDHFTFASNGSQPINVIVGSFPASTTVKPFAFRFDQTVTPSLTNISPASGIEGTILTITGSMFDPVTSNNQVFVGTTPCSIINSTVSTIECTVSASVSGHYEVSVYVAGLGKAAPTCQGTGVPGCNTLNTAGAYKTFSSDPIFELSVEILDITPARGSTEGFNQIDIFGSGFPSDPQYVFVSVGDAACLVQSVNTTNVTCTTGKPAAPGSYPIRVTVHQPETLVLGGLYASYYQFAQSGNVPDLSGRTPDVTAVENQVYFPYGLAPFTSVSFVNQFAVDLNGYIKIDYVSTYTFYLSADDGANLYIDGALVVNNGGSHGFVERSGSVLLREGFHSIRVTHYQQGGSTGLMLSYSEAKIAKQIVPSTALFYNTDDEPLQTVVAVSGIYTYDPLFTPTITSVTPSVGVANANITLIGSGFTTESEPVVMIGGLACDVSVFTSTQIICEVAANYAGVYNLSVYDAINGRAACPFSYDLILNITNAITVSTGFGGGIYLTLAGAGFSPLFVTDDAVNVTAVTTVVSNPGACPSNPSGGVPLPTPTAAPTPTPTASATPTPTPTPTPAPSNKCPKPTDKGPRIARVAPQDVAKCVAKLPKNCLSCALDLFKFSSTCVKCMLGQSCLRKMYTSCVKYTHKPKGNAWGWLSFLFGLNNNNNNNNDELNPCCGASYYDIPIINALWTLLSTQITVIPPPPTPSQTVYSNYEMLGRQSPSTDVTVSGSSVTTTAPALCTAVSGTVTTYNVSIDTTGVDVPETAPASTTVISVCNAKCTISAVHYSVLVCELSQYGQFTNINQLRALPSNVSCPITVSVTTSGVTKSVSYANMVNFKQTLTPDVSNVSPTRGGTAGGTVVTITGSGFSLNNADNLVWLGSTLCSVFSSSYNQLLCRSGASTSSTVQPVTVTVAGRGYAVTNGSTFEYIDLWSSSYSWGNGPLPVAGDSVYIGANQTMLLDVSPPPLVLILIEGGTLIFDDSLDLSLEAKYIVIDKGGRLQIGTESQPFTHKATVTLAGTPSSQEIPLYGSKVLALRRGTLDIHGTPVNQSSVKLAQTVAAGAISVVLAEPVAWSVGQTVVLSSTSGNPNEVEERVISAISSDQTQLFFGLPLKYTHLSFRETAVELVGTVALISRNVVIQGDSDSSSTQFGGQIMVSTPQVGTATVRIENAEIRSCGQSFRVGRFPIFFRLNGNMLGSYVKHSSIHSGYNRGIVIQGSNQITLDDNVVYNVFGHGIALENGAENNNQLSKNVVIKVKSSTSLIATDQTPAGIYVNSPNNFFLDNVVSSASHYAYWFSLPGNPQGQSAGSGGCPISKPLGSFVRNGAHSNGLIGLYIDQFKPSNNLNGCGGASTVAVFDSFSAWRNPTAVQANSVGAVVMQNASLVENTNGFLIKAVSSPWNSAFIRNSTVVAQSSLNGMTTQVGIQTPQSNYMTVSAVQFVNFNKPSSYAFRPCVSCNGFSAGFRTRFNQIQFTNSPNKFNLYNSYQAIFEDTDGSVTGSTPALIVPQSRLLPSACVASANVSSGLSVAVAICTNVRLHRTYINNVASSYYSQYSINVTNSLGTVTLKDYIWFTVSDGVYNVDWNVDYSVMFANPDPDSFKITCEDMVNPDIVYFTHVYTSEINNIQLKSDDGLITSNTTSLTDAPNGRWTFNTSTGNLTWVVSSTDLDQVIVGDRSVIVAKNVCPEAGCVLDGVLIDKRVMKYFMSSRLSFLRTTLDFIIPSNWEYVIDTVSPRFRNCINYGKITYNSAPTGYSFTGRLNCQRLINFGVISGNRKDVIQQGPSFFILSLVNDNDQHQPIEPYMISNNLQFGTKTFVNFGTVNFQGMKQFKDTGYAVGSGYEKLNRTANLLSPVPAGAMYVDIVIQSGSLLGSVPAVTTSGATFFQALEQFFKCNTTILLESADTDSTKVDYVQLSQDMQILNDTVGRLHFKQPLKYAHVPATTVTENGVSILRAPKVIDMGGSMVIEGEVDPTNPNAPGCRIYNGVYTQFPAQGGSAIPITYTGSFFVNRTSIRNCGQVMSALPGDPVAALTVVNTNNVFILDSIFANAANGAIVLQGTASNFSLIDSSIVNTNGTAVSVATNNNTFVGNYISLVRSVTPSKPTIFAGFDVVGRFNELRNNVVYGSDSMGYNLRWADPCVASAAEPWIYSNNTASFCLHGVHMYATTRTDCTLIQGFKSFSNQDFGLFVHARSNVTVSNVFVADNAVGINVNVQGGSSSAHVLEEKQIIIQNSVIAGNAPNQLSDFCSIQSRFSSCYSFSDSSDRVGLLMSTFTESMAQSSSCGGWGSFNTNPSIRGVVTVQNVTFTNFHNDSCGRRHIAIENNVNAVDAQHPHIFSQVQWQAVDVDSRIALIQPKVCGSLPCDGPKHIILKDVDGTLLSSAVAPSYLIPQAENGFNVSQIPSSMYISVNGTTVDPQSVIQNTGIARSAGCSLNSSFNGYTCSGTDYLMLVLESMDSDTYTRRLGPVALTANGYTDLLNGPVTHGMCSSGVCGLRLSTFWSVVAVGNSYNVDMAGIAPSNVRLHLLNSDNSKSVALSLFYTSAPRLDVYFNGQYVPPTNAHYDPTSSSYVYSGFGSQYTPTVGMSSGSNYFDPSSRRLSVIVRGPSSASQFVQVVTVPVVSASFSFGISIDDFYGANLLQNLITLLGIPANQIRIVQIIPASRRLLAGSSSGPSITVTVQIGPAPAATLDSTTVEFDSTVVYTDVSQLPAVTSSSDTVSYQSAFSTLTDLIQTGTLSEQITAYPLTGYDVVIASAPASQLESISGVTDVKVPTFLSVVSTAGSALTGQSFSVTLKLQDQDGELITDLKRQWAVTASLIVINGTDTNVTLQGTTTVYIQNGLASFTDLRIVGEGEYTCQLAFSSSYRNLAATTNLFAIESKHDALGSGLQVAAIIAGSVLGAVILGGLLLHVYRLRNGYKQEKTKVTRSLIYQHSLRKLSVVPISTQKTVMIRISVPPAPHLPSAITSSLSYAQTTKIELRFNLAEDDVKERVEQFVNKHSFSNVAAVGLADLVKTTIDSERRNDAKGIQTATFMTQDGESVIRINSTIHELELKGTELTHMCDDTPPASPTPSNFGSPRIHIKRPNRELSVTTFPDLSLPNDNGLQIIECPPSPLSPDERTSLIRQPTAIQRIKNKSLSDVLNK